MQSAGLRKGSMMVFVSLGMLAFMGLSGLAVDSSMFFRQKGLIQQAVDAGLIAGITIGISDRPGYSSFDSRKYSAKYAALQMAEFSANSHGLDMKKVKFTADTAESTLETGLILKMTGELQSETFFLKFLNISPTIKASGTAVRPPALISLVLDASGSMSVAEYDDMIKGAKEFCRYFIDNLDTVFVSMFGTKAQLIESTGKPSKAVEALDVYDRAQLGGWTNLHEGILIAQNAMRGRPNFASSSVIKGMVIFSDGAPSVMTVNFRNRREDKPITNNAADYDTVNGIYPPDQNYPANVAWAPLPVSNPPTYYNAHTDGAPNYFYYVHEMSNNMFRNPDTLDIPPCSFWDNNGPNGRSNRWEVFDCLSNFAYADSRGAIHALPPTPPNNLSYINADGTVRPGMQNPAFIQDGNGQFANEYMNVCIYETDYLKRNDNISIFTIGYGPEVSTGPPQVKSMENHFHQGADNAFDRGFYLHRYFLMKLANDPKGNDSGVPQLRNCDGDATGRMWYCLGNYPRQNYIAEGEPTGGFVYSDSREDIEQMFKSIARKFIERITS